MQDSTVFVSMLNGALFFGGRARGLMRTNIVIDDQLMAEALKASGYETKKEAVEQGLKLLVQLSKQQEIRKLRGEIKWEGDLDEMRSAG